MEDVERIFLTPAEALAAVRMDADLYGPQPDLWAGLLRLLARRTGTRPEEDERCGGMPPPDGLADAACAELAACAADLDILAAAVGLVFETRAEPGAGPDGEPGVYVRTGMEGFDCGRCGHCCRTLSFHAECEEEDLERWRAAGRDDILAWVGGGGEEPGMLWVRPGAGLLTEQCPWLFQEPDGLFTCTIHDLKPALCRDFPGSRKHARLTGCPGMKPA
ncbi:MAG: YkgJ family cysteine cluster protein [Thermodesulfobacteriota bacterium]